ncbi:MAG: IS110 family transposase [Anaerolineae bacterium]|nr:IS110 family transposase [Anaerolineae bacterium]
MLDLTAPNWWHDLASIIPPGSTVVLEPTGGNYTAPLLANLHGRAVWHARHTASGAVRHMHIASAKTDQLDARALALIASWTADGRPPRGVKLVTDTTRSELATTLRLVIYHRQRAVKEATRLLNQLDQVAYAIAPSLAKAKESWLRVALTHRTLTPSEIAEALPEIHAATRRTLQKAIDNAPPSANILRHSQRIAIHTLLDALEAMQKTEAEATATLAYLVVQQPITAITEAWQAQLGVTPTQAAHLHAATHCQADQLNRGAFKSLLGVAPPHPCQRQLTEQRPSSRDAER